MVMRLMILDPQDLGVKNYDEILEDLRANWWFMVVSYRDFPGECQLISHWLKLEKLEIRWKR